MAKKKKPKQTIYGILLKLKNDESCYIPLNGVAHLPIMLMNKVKTVTICAAERDGKIHMYEGKVNPSKKKEEQQHV